MKVKLLVLAAAAALLPAAVLAAEVYTGLGLSGATLGYADAASGRWGLRGELAGGVSMSRDGQREGLNYDGKFKAARGAIFVDWFVLGSGFRLTGGATQNDYTVTLDGKGSSGTINGKPVDLSNESFRVDVAYARTTPYLGLGWGHRAAGTGLGLYVDVGAQFGRYRTETSTTVVGKYGITQADVDAETQKVRDTLARYGVLPSLGMGLTYRF
jgi:hypothetical protein